jgi:hypothetical protein
MGSIMFLGGAGNPLYSLRTNSTPTRRFRRVSRRDDTPLFYINLWAAVMGLVIGATLVAGGLGFITFGH